MLRATVHRTPDHEAAASRNVAWNLLTRKQSGDRNMSILVQRFEPGGDFADHSHDLVQFFYITKGRFELTIGGQKGVYREGDFVSVERNEPHSGRNVSEGESELIAVDYWPADSRSRLGLD
jgi:quercetin dioxygenase-like cupin family protein